MGKPILCLDFDGVIHSYESGWKGADKIPDPPVPGALAFIAEAVNHFDVYVFSSRSNQSGGRFAMQAWLRGHMCAAYQGDGHDIVDEIKWPDAKPPAMVTIDDRALTFDGTWPAIDTLKAFQPWNKRVPT